MPTSRKRHKPGKQKKPARSSWQQWLYLERSDTELLCTDADLADPERLGLVVKYHFASYVTTREPGRSKLQAWENSIAHGPLTFFPNIKDWAIEEFLYHGVPGDNWQPMDAYLAFVGSHLSEVGREKLRQWQRAELGAYYMGAVHEPTVRLQHWDVARDAPVGPEFAALSLALGGARAHRGQEGRLLIMYVAPWELDRNLYCAMGYGAVLPRRELGMEQMLLSPSFFAQAAKPYPLPVGVNRQEVMREWRAREWLSWLSQRLSFPFPALVPLPPTNRLGPATVVGFAPITPEQARQFGIYVEVPGANQEVVIAGLTSVIPLEVGSPTWEAVIEYHAFRQLAGPPPGVPRGQTFLRLR